MYIILDEKYYNNFGCTNLYSNLNRAKDRIEQLNNEFPTNSFTIFELKRID